MELQLAILAVFVFLYSLVSGRVDRMSLSGPIVFVGAGLLMGPTFLGWFPEGETRSTLRTLADLTLALFLFTDAANANLNTLKVRFGVPARLLLLGLPMSILLGFGLALVLFDVLTVFEAAILGTMLAATDAALGKAVVTNPVVPDRLREGLNVESGLNDGLCVPILFVFIALELGSETALGEGLILKLLAEELGVGVLVGLLVAAAGAYLMRYSARIGWIDPVWSQITTGALALSCFAIAQSLHGSGYIASFTGGLLFGHLLRKETAHLIEPAEGIAEVLALLTWFLFGSAVVGQAFSKFTWTIGLYAVLTLTVVRMLPVYLSMTGSGESARARWFLGWFGPRGMASIVFAIIVLDEGLTNAEFMALVVVCTVLMSLVLHGITAWKYANWLGLHETDHS